ncbi:hypothetical protein [Listeria rocourtiae]|uniref:hypothetical protein n=1 Tax=Listeria rocourtiae TaxID=647910 RepID=UPI0003E89A52|nr:hypothetical protein [Listeria rocourtiae]EUJ46652.1 hypothetical protein PROCOU_11073 [Listeria rocourtiae FSL F6-920]
MNENKTPESQLRASENWTNKNKERKQYINRRSVAKRFIQNDATMEDLDMLLDIIEQKKKKPSKLIGGLVVFKIRASSSITASSAKCYPYSL